MPPCVPPHVRRNRRTCQYVDPSTWTNIIHTDGEPITVIKDMDLSFRQLERALHRVEWQRQEQSNAGLSHDDPQWRALYKAMTVIEDSEQYALQRDKARRYQAKCKKIEAQADLKEEKAYRIIVTAMARWRKGRGHPTMVMRDILPFEPRSKPGETAGDTAAREERGNCGVQKWGPGIAAVAKKRLAKLVTARLARQEK